MLRFFDKKYNSTIKPRDKDDLFKVEKEAYTGPGIIINSKPL